MRKRRNPHLKLINKAATKKLIGHCIFCPKDKINDYVTLEVHRLVPENGYVMPNVLILCSDHHSIVTFTNRFKIDKKYQTSTGKWLLHYWDEEGEENWKELPYG